MKKLMALAVLALIIIVALFAVAPGVHSATSSTNVSGNIATGWFTTAGTAVNVSLGWTPRVVVVTKVTNTIGRAEWDNTMADATCFKQMATWTTLTATGCVSPYTGSSTASPGFTLGTDGDLNTASGDKIRWKAYR